MKLFYFDIFLNSLSMWSLYLIAVRLHLSLQVVNRLIDLIWEVWDFKGTQARSTWKKATDFVRIYHKYSWQSCLERLQHWVLWYGGLSTSLKQESQICLQVRRLSEVFGVVVSVSLLVVLYSLWKEICASAAVTKLLELLHIRNKTCIGLLLAIPGSYENSYLASVVRSALNWHWYKFLTDN